MPQQSGGPPLPLRSATRRSASGAGSPGGRKMRKYIDLGFRIIAVGHELAILRSAYKKRGEAIRKPAVGDASSIGVLSVRRSRQAEEERPVPSRTPLFTR